MLRGEITLEASHQRKIRSWDSCSKENRPCGPLVDMKIDGPHDCEYFVVESAKHALHEDSGEKYDKDRNRLARHMNDMLWRLDGKRNMGTNQDTVPTSHKQPLSSLLHIG